MIAFLLAHSADFERHYNGQVIAGVAVLAYLHMNKYKSSIEFISIDMYGNLSNVKSNSYPLIRETECKSIDVDAIINSYDLGIMQCAYHRGKFYTTKHFDRCFAEKKVSETCTLNSVFNGRLIEHYNQGYKGPIANYIKIDGELQQIPDVLIDKCWSEKSKSHDNEYVNTELLNYLHKDPTKSPRDVLREFVIKLDSTGQYVFNLGGVEVEVMFPKFNSTHAYGPMDVVNGVIMEDMLPISCLTDGYDATGLLYFNNI